MKNFKKILAAILCLLLSVSLLSACGNTSNPDTDLSSASPAPAENTNEPDSGEKIKVGILQLGSHASLDNCCKGIIDALNASASADKFDINLQNGNFDSPTCDIIAKNMVAQNYDIIFAIATPAAVAAYSAAQGTDIPVIFCAVSDPVAAGLVESFETPGANCTGTSDILNFPAQIELIKSLQPDVRKVGVLYTTSEANSVSQLATLKECLEANDLELVSIGVQTAADIPQAASSIVTKADCLNNLTDNNVVNSLNILLEQANAAGIPVYGSEVEQVQKGCLAAAGIDYVALGNATGEIGLEVLGGTPASELSVRKISDVTPVINSDVAAAFEFEISENIATVTTIDETEE